MNDHLGPIEWLAERNSLQIALEIQTGGIGESSEESRAKAWIVDQLDRVLPGWDERHADALFAFAAGDHEPAVLLGHDIRSVVVPLARIARSRGEAPWRGARDRNADVLHSFGIDSGRPSVIASAATLAPARTAPRTRGAGRPAARLGGPRSTRAGPSDDDGPLADEPPGATGPEAAR